MSDVAELTRRLVTSINTKDFEWGAAQVADDAEIVGASGDHAQRGPDGYRFVTQTWLEGFPDAQIEVVNLLADGEWAFVEMVSRGTHTGVLRDFTSGHEIPATGRAVELHLCDVFRFRDGKMVLNRSYFDSAELARQLGLMPEQ